MRQVAALHDPALPPLVRLIVADMNDPLTAQRAFSHAALRFVGRMRERLQNRFDPLAQVQPHQTKHNGKSECRFSHQSPERCRNRRRQVALYAPLVPGEHAQSAPAQFALQPRIPRNRLQARDDFLISQKMGRCLNRRRANASLFVMQSSQQAAHRLVAPLMFKHPQRQYALVAIRMRHRLHSGLHNRPRRWIPYLAQCVLWRQPAV